MLPPIRQIQLYVSTGLLLILFNQLKSSTGFYVPSYRRTFQNRHVIHMMSSDKTLLECISESCSLALSRSVILEPTHGGGASGGGGATTMAVKDVTTGEKYFVKTAPISSGGTKMLYGEYRGEMMSVHSFVIQGLFLSLLYL
jgi:hypothetical protein